MKALAVKYRPTTFEDVTEQSCVTALLKNQLEANEIKNAYLFCGGAGTGKTTCARIFANEINQNKGTPIEMDAASNSSVEDVRDIIQKAKTKSISGQYKIFIIDECHSISNTGWQAFLKLLEEPPATSIFIFCTTDPQKIPKTILSRVQRYDFQRISHKGIVNRLLWILNKEQNEANEFYNIEKDAVEYIAKLADGGMRDAITLMDKCLSYNKELSMKNVVAALGVADYSEMFKLLWALVSGDAVNIINGIESVHKDGKDLKQFIKGFLNFTVDVCKYNICGGSFDCIQIPNTYKEQLDSFKDVTLLFYLEKLMKLNGDIKWDNAPKSMIEATLLSCCTM